MGMTPLVSVCCTTFNLENYIAGTIDSVLAQKTEFSFEFIIHDDASSDKTQNIITSYAEKYPDLIKTVFQKKNIYTSHPGKLGYMFNNYILPETDGKYIAILDGDDYWIDPEKLQKQVEHLEATPESVGCFTNAYVENEISEISKKKFHNKPEDKFPPEKRMIVQAGAMFPTSTLMFRKKDFESSVIYPNYDDFAKYLDYDTLFLYCLMLAGRVSCLHDVTAIYRRWGGGIFSGIMHDPEKVSELKEMELQGTKKLLGMVDKRKRKMFRRKISVDALYVLRNQSGYGKLRYIKDLHIKEFIRFLTLLK